MRDSKRVATMVAALALLAAAGVAAAIAVRGGGDDDAREPADPAVGPAPDPAEVARPERQRHGEDPAERGQAEQGAVESESGSRARAERAAQRAYRDHLDAINARDGAAICELLAPGSIAELDPPRRRNGCAATLRASIGYSDPRGSPVWEATALSEIEGVLARDRGTARVTAAIVTRFVDREQPSIESDVAHLERAGGRWRLAKPSVALHRAVGKPDIPPRVLGPP